MVHQCSLFVFFTFILSPSFAATVATAKLVKGRVEMSYGNKSKILNVNDEILEGATIKTAEKSFVKLLFIDKSQINVGSASEMKISKFSGKDSGVIDMVKGKIRSQVSKDYLQMDDKNKSKMFIKTSNAVMGIRGTDFMVSTHENQTTTVLFEGDVVFNDNGGLGANATSQQLENAVNAGVHIEPGQFSVVDLTHSGPTIPSAMNVQQIETLEKNVNFDQPRAPSHAETPANSIVPEGLDGKVASNNVETLNAEIAQIPSVIKETESDGFVSGDSIKPAGGSFVHIESGMIIPPGPGSAYDANTGTYIADASTGTVGGDGSYIPPKDVTITQDGKMLVEVKDAQGNVKVQQIDPPKPVFSATSIPLAAMSEALAANPQATVATATFKDDILNPNFVRSGLMDFTNLQLNSSGSIQEAIPNEALINNSSTDLRIRINP